jgi:hypothetical protein
MKHRVQFPLFLSTFLTPIPYLGLASVFGMKDLFVLFQRKNRFLNYLIANSVFLIFLVLFANLTNEVKLSYEEVKRLAVLVCSLTTGLYFIARVDIGNYDTRQRNRVILILSLGWLISSKVFWKLPSTLQYANYSWFKFAGASALILFALQIYMMSRFRDSVFVWILLGILLTSISILNDAKSIAIHMLILIFLRLGLTNEFRTRKGILNNVVHNRYRVVRTMIVTLIMVSTIIFMAQSGLLGLRAEALSGQYGNNLSGLLFRARPEFTFSLQILQNLPFLGYGTIADPYNHIRLEIVSSSTLTGQEQHFLLNRILLNGFNLHSWAFDLVARAGFLCFLPIFWYSIQLIRSIFSFELIAKYPGLTYISIVCLEDLFFSPYSWFVSIQIAFSFLGIYLTHSLSKPSDESGTIAKIKHHYD